jgi:2,4-dienoyl-CoA reductase-like NADH-dependent reductase (Old Yellow Enzyme family)
MRWDDRRAESHLGRDIPVHLLREVEKFLRTSKISAAAFGCEVMRDPRFVFDLRKGREPRIQTVTRVRAYLEAEL